MTKTMIGAAAGLLMLVVPSVVQATTWMEQEFTCPIGGEKFEASVVGSNSSFGQRPDGKPYSPLPVVPMVECPSNGLPLYQEKFADDEVKRVTPLVASAEFQALRKSDTQFYRLWWLKQKMGGRTDELVRALMIAGWESDGDAARKARYQQAFADAAATLDESFGPSEQFWVTLRRTNALRELGKFDEAAAALDRVRPQISTLTDSEERIFATDWIEKLSAVIAARVPASEPATLVPVNRAMWRCVIDRDTLAPIELPICNGAEVTKALAQVEVESENGAKLKGADALRHIAARGGGTD